MKWCNYCHAYRKSWAESLSNYVSYSDNQCWSCDNWTLCCNRYGCHGCHDHGTSEAVREANQRNNTLSSENTRLHDDLREKAREVGEKSGQIIAINNELTTTKNQLTETKGELTVARGKVEELTGLFTNLQIESNNKDNKIEIKSQRIKTLKGEVEKFKEEDFNRKFKEQEDGLDELVQKLGISRQKYRDLLKFYQQSIRFSENYNQDKIDEAEEGIEAIKDELLSDGWLKRGMSLKDVQGFCSKCKEFAHLKVEKGKKQEQRWKEQQQQQQQYEAQQEVPPHNNNSN